MADKIFTKYASIQKNQLFMTLINHMKSVGWTRLNEGHATTGAKLWIMHSKGSTGDRPMYMSLAPFDGYDVIGNASYDIRSTDCSDAVYRMGGGYDPSTGDIIAPFSGTRYETFSFFTGRNYGYAQGGYALKANQTGLVDFYIYADPDFVVFLVQPAPSTTLGNTLTFFGIPEKTYLQENNTNFYTNFIMGTSGRSTSNNQIMVLERPTSWTRNNVSYLEDTKIVLSPFSPNIDGVFQLSDVYYGRDDEGVRGKLGNGFYILNLGTGAIVDGDTIQVRVDGNIQNYRYCVLQTASNYQSSFPVRGCAIRIS